MTTRQQMLDTVTAPIDGQPPRLSGLDSIADEHSAVAVYRDDMDFHAYLHLRGHDTVDAAFAFLTKLGVDYDDNRHPVGVINLDASSRDEALITPRLAAGATRPLADLPISN